MNFNFFIENDGVKLNSYANQKEKRSEQEILFLLGLNEDSKVFESELDYYQNSYCAAVNLRGSGKSDSPSMGYSSKDFSADISSIFDSLKLKNPIVVTSGLTSVYFLKYYFEKKPKIKGLIFLNCGASTVPLDDSWFNQFKTSLNPVLSNKAARRLLEDSEFINYYPELSQIECPLYLLTKSDKLEEENAYDISDFKRFAEKIIIKELSHSKSYIEKEDLSVLRETIEELF